MTRIDKKGQAMITSAEKMYDAVMSLGIIPFFSGSVPGFSIQDLTPRAYWFDEGDILGPWDWKRLLLRAGGTVNS